MTSLAKCLPFLPLALVAQDLIQEVPLNDRVAIEVPIATNRVTALNFPGPIAAIDGASISADPKIPGLFQLAHTQGSAFLSLRATQPGAKANLNVRWKDRTYVFLLREDPEPVLSLNLVPAPQPKALPAPRLSTTRLLALLDKAKAFPLLKEQHPHAVAGVEFRTFATQTNLTDYGDFRIQVEEVYHFQHEDSLVFRTTFHNPGPTPVTYDPVSLAVRVGNLVYPQSISDAPGVIPPQGHSTIYLAITGSPDGGRADLSLKNSFQILVTRTPSPAQP
jgi:hypothetical protein